MREANVSGGTAGAGSDKYVVMPNNNFLKSKQIENNNSTTNAKIFSDSYYIGTPASYTSLQDYIVNQVGTHSNEQFQNFWVYPSNINYLQLELKDGDASYPDSGLKTDVLIVNKMAEIENLIAHQFTCSSSGSDLFDFFDTAGNLLWKAGQAYADYKLAKKMLKFGGAAAAIAITLSVAGNIIYNVAQDASTPDYLAQSKEYGSEDSAGNTRFSCVENPIGHPDNGNTLYTFAMNSWNGRLTSAGYTMTETAGAGMGSSNPDTEFIMYSIVMGHDKQRSISFQQYSNVSEWNTGAKMGQNGGGTGILSGSAMWDRRLCAIDVSGQTAQFTPRLRFNHSDNIIAYQSDIPTTTIQYWEDVSGYFQPNLASGAQGVIQLTSSVFNIYADVYLSSDKKIIFGGDSNDGNIYWDEAGGDNLIFKSDT